MRSEYIGATSILEMADTIDCSPAQVVPDQSTIFALLSNLTSSSFAEFNSCSRHPADQKQDGAFKIKAWYAIPTYALCLTLSVFDIYQSVFIQLIQCFCKQLSMSSQKSYLLRLHFKSYLLRFSQIKLTQVHSNLPPFISVTINHWLQMSKALVNSQLPISASISHHPVIP